MVQQKLEEFFTESKIDRKDIIKMDCHSVVVNEAIVWDDKVTGGIEMKVLNKVMIAYEDISSPETKLKEEFQSILKKNSGPRRGMKRGPYRKKVKGGEMTVEKLWQKKQVVDLGTLVPNSGVHPVLTEIGLDDVKRANSPPRTEVVLDREALDRLGDEMGIPRENKQQSEREYYEGLNMVVVSPPKHVKDDGEP